MNIEDFKPLNYSWDEIFQLQKQLGFSYIPELKEKSGDFDINIYDDQELFRTMCWRITEELMEAQEAFNTGNVPHLKEELIDALNFTIELYGLYGWTVHNNLGQTHVVGYVLTQIGGINIKNNVTYGNPVSQINHIVYTLGMAANCLKSRQWRKSQYMVDLYVFEERFRSLWRKFMQIFYELGMTDSDVRQLWSLKYQVNKFRLESNY